MTDIVFRGQNDKTPNISPEVEKPTGESTTQNSSDTEAPFTLYESAKGQNPVGEYYGFGVGEKSQEGEGVDYYGSFKTIEEYFKDKIEHGEIENSVEAVKSLLQKYEKTLGIEKSERNVVKIEKMVAYVKFKKEVDEIARNNFKYGRK